MLAGRTVRFPQLPPGPDKAENTLITNTDTQFAGEIEDYLCNNNARFRGKMEGVKLSKLQVPEIILISHQLNEY